MEPIVGQGATFSWGTVTDILLTSVSWQAGSGGGNEIDITSMSSLTLEDQENTGKKLVKRDFDSAFAGEGDVSLSVEFFLDAGLMTAGFTKSAIGLKRDLTLKLRQPPATAGSEGAQHEVVSGKAILTQVSAGVSVGELASGSATFRLTGN